MANSFKAGDKYNLLELTGESKRNKFGKLIVEVLCKCGNKKFIDFSRIKMGRVKSCGCKRIKHGMADFSNPIYRTWNNIKQRCHNPNNIGYKWYGNKGITVCDEWRKDFKSFYDWAVSNGWKEGLTIERNKNNLGYSPDNCRWTTNCEQQRNKNNNVNLTAFGETKCKEDWVLDGRAEVAYNTISYRINKLGWSSEKAISTPSMNLERSNRRNAIIVEYDNQKRELREWCNKLGVDYKLVRNRMYKGWNIKEALETKQLKYYTK